MKTYNSYILFIHFSVSNILLTVTNLDGTLLKTFRVGSYKTSGVKKINLTAIKTLVSSASKFLRNTNAHIKCCGSSRSKRLLVKLVLKLPRLKILTLCDMTSLPHNGVRKPKRRRV